MTSSRSPSQVLTKSIRHSNQDFRPTVVFLQIPISVQRLKTTIDRPVICRQQYLKGIVRIAQYNVLIRSKSPLFYYRFGTFEESFSITPSNRPQGPKPLGFDPWPSDDDVGLGSKYTASFDAVAHANLTGLGLLLLCQVNADVNQPRKPSSLIDILDLV
jgi:hypothetical protein